MESVTLGRLIICVSPDGESNWQPLKPDEVPEWLKKSDVLGQMVEGHIAHNSKDEGAPWFCAVRVPEKIEAANDELPDNVSPIVQPEKHLVVPPLLVTSGGIPIPDGGDAA